MQRDHSTTFSSQVFEEVQISLAAENLGTNSLGTYFTEEARKRAARTVAIRTMKAETMATKTRAISTAIELSCFLSTSIVPKASAIKPPKLSSDFQSLQVEPSYYAFIAQSAESLTAAIFELSQAAQERVLVVSLSIKATKRIFTS